MTARNVLRLVLATVAALAVGAVAGPAGGADTSPGSIATEAHTSLSVACFGDCPPNFDDFFNQAVDGIDGVAASSYTRAKGAASASVDEPAGSLRASISGGVDLPSAQSGAAASNQGNANAEIADTITLSAPATILLEGRVGGRLSLSRGAGNDGVEFPVQLGARIEFTGGIVGEDRVVHGSFARGYVHGDSPNETFSVPIDLPAGTSNLNARIAAFTDFRISSGHAESGAVEDGSLTFRVVVPAGVTATSGSGLLPGTSGRTPHLSLADAQVSEGDADTTLLELPVTLSSASAGAVTVDFRTGDGSATAGDDYEAASGTLRFAPGETTQTISVTVVGDGLAEEDETVVVRLRNANGASIAAGEAVGTIVDDDRARPPGGPCIVVRPETPVDFGTRAFSRAGAPVQAPGSPPVTVENCGTGPVQVQVSGTNATGPSASWGLGESADPCAAGANVYALALGTLVLSSAAKPLGSLAAGAARTETPTLTMPCTGSGGAGETLALQLRFTALAASSG